MQITELTHKVSNLYVHIDKQKHYSGRTCLLINSIEENWNEDTDTLSISITNEHLGLYIQPYDNDWMHCIGNKNKALKNGRAIIIKFTRYNIRKTFSWIIKESLKFDFLTNGKVDRYEILVWI